MVAEGYNCFTFASMLMVDNMHDAEPLVDWRTMGINIASRATRPEEWQPVPHGLAEKMAEFKAVCRRIVQLKRELRPRDDVRLLLETLPEFYEKRHIDGCKAGKIRSTSQPKGMVHPARSSGRRALLRVLARRVCRS